MEKLRNFFKDGSGVSTVEYALLAGLIALVCILALTSLGTNLSGQFQAVATGVGGAGS